MRMKQKMCKLWNSDKLKPAADIRVILNKCFFFLKSVAPLKSLDYTNSYNEFDKILQNKV